jgi:hypothetical protein
MSQRSGSARSVRSG